MVEDNEKLTTEHEIYLSVGLNIPMKTSVFKEIVDTLLFENIGYMQSWGTHTQAEYIGIIDEQDARIKQLEAEVERLTHVSK